MGVYNTDFDIESRAKIAEIINELKPKSILVVGSPSIRELSNINNAKGIDIVCIDSRAPSTTIKFNSFKSIKGNVLDFKSNAIFDVVLIRWVLHHLTTSEKVTLTKKCFEFLKKGGSLVCQDWFIPDYNNHEERTESAEKYFNYHHEVKPGLSPAWGRKTKTQLKNAEISNGKGGKFTSTIKYGEILDSIFGNYSSITLHEDLVDNPKLFGDVIFISEKREN